MRYASVFMSLFFLLALAWVLLSFFLPSIADVAAESIGRQGIGSANIPPHIREQWDRGEGKWRPKDWQAEDK